MGGDRDRIEREDDGFRGRVAAGVPASSRDRFPDRYLTVDGAAAPERDRRGDPWSPSQRFLSRPRRSGCSTAALADGDAHAYLFHGPAGVGKTAAAFAFAGALLGDARRVVERTHPDLRVVEPLGDMIRIDVIRELHHDLHLRPFEADRRVYLLLGAHLLNDDAADALLKDLEEPPLYATIVLVADELGPIPETIRSRCQLVPFRRLSERAVEAWLTEHAPELGRGRGDGDRAGRRRAASTAPAG